MLHDSLWPLLTSVDVLAAAPKAGDIGIRDLGALLDNFQSESQDYRGSGII